MGQYQIKLKWVCSFVQEQPVHLLTNTHSSLNQQSTRLVAYNPSLLVAELGLGWVAGSGQEYQNAVPLSAQVQPLSPTTTKYNLVIEVAGRKQ